MKVFFFFKTSINLSVDWTVFIRSWFSLATEHTMKCNHKRKCKSPVSIENERRRKHKHKDIEEATF